MKTLVPLILGLFCIFGTAQEKKYSTIKKSLQLMGSRFEITIVALTEEKANSYIDIAIAEIRRIEDVISSWDINSETSRININAGKQPVKVSKELFDLITRAEQISEITDGAFDITYASVDELWQFDGSMEEMPSELDILNSVSKVGFKNIILNKAEQTVFLKEEGMKIGFGAIGKGYAADKVKVLMKTLKVPGGIINASGDLTTWGTRESGKKWLVGITSPLNKNKVFSWLPIDESSVATSGNYEKFITFKEEKYSHIIDPRTGYPSKGIKSVSVFAKNAELCDALATAVFIMGRETGLSRVNQLKGVEVIIIDDENKIHKSDGIQFDNNY